MKIKQIGRAVGTVQTLISGLATYELINLITHIDYSKISEFLTGNYTIEQKVTNSATLGIIYGLVPATALMTIDGIVDITKGTHHYFALRVWQKLARSKEKKNKIESELEKLLKTIKKPFIL